MKNENEQFEFWNVWNERTLRISLPNEEHIEAMILEGEAAIRSAEERPQDGPYGREDSF